MRETNFNDRAYSMLVLAPSRTVGVYAKMPEPAQESPAGAALPGCGKEASEVERA